LTEGEGIKVGKIEGIKVGKNVDILCELWYNKFILKKILIVLSVSNSNIEDQRN
jgi:hypothetical protein